MLAIQKRDSTDRCIPNVLPCRIHHSGATKVTKRYWTVKTLDDGTTITHFRGRRLKGRAVKIPQRYQGLVLKSTENTLPVQPRMRLDRLAGADEESGEEEEQDVPEPVMIVEQISSFNEIIIWDHDQVPAGDDTFVKGIEEWVSLAEAIHKSDSPSDA